MNKLLSGGSGGRGNSFSASGGGGISNLYGTTTPPPPSPVGVPDGTLYLKYADKYFLTSLYEAMHRSQLAVTWVQNLAYEAWNNAILSGNGSWYAIHSNGLQIVMGGYIDGVNCMVTSLDGGFTWQVCNDANLFDHVNGIAYGNGVWVAVGSGTFHSKAYSYDGINWVGLGIDNPLNVGYCVRFNGTYFVAGGDPAIATDPVAQYSADGVTWFNTDLNKVAVVPGFNNMSMVVWDGSNWWANTSYDNRNMAYSANGINWTTYMPVGIGIKYPLSIEYGSPSGGTPIYVLVGRSAAGGVNSIAYSADGVNWTNLGVTYELRLDQVVWNGSLFVAVSSDQTVNSIVYSPDGINWTGAGVILPYGGYAIGIARMKT